jgi:hypothetical protein
MKPKVLTRSDIGSFQYERRKLIKAKAFAQRHGISVINAYGRV